MNYTNNFLDDLNLVANDNDSQSSSHYNEIGSNFNTNMELRFTPARTPLSHGQQSLSIVVANGYCSPTSQVMSPKSHPAYL